MTGQSPLPPRQIATTKFPRIGEREPEEFDHGTWSLVVDGLVKEPLALSIDAFYALPHVKRCGTIHCVTRWSRPDTTFRGVALAEILRRATPTTDARFVRFASGRGHDTTLPLQLAASEVLLADGLALEPTDDIEPLPAPHGGPLRSLILSRYFYKSVKWLRRIELLAHDQLGTWEREAGYHNEADPWQEQRYVVRGVDRDVLTRLLATRSFAGHDLLGANLRGRDLTGFDLTAANLRNADLRHTRLVGADLRETHFCNADLRGADLSLALLDGVDFDGADLRTTDLRGARGVPGFIAATQFTDGEESAQVGGLDWRGLDASGALDDQLAFLRERGVLRPA